jgi:hypothetical protein
MLRWRLLAVVALASIFSTLAIFHPDIYVSSANVPVVTMTAPGRERLCPNRPTPFPTDFWFVKGIKAGPAKTIHSDYRPL